MSKTSQTYRATCNRFCRAIGRWLGSDSFFLSILFIFTTQALWIAWSGAYSMAYDEFFHLGIIQEYAKGWTPFIEQPAGPAVLGAVARDPSFLYHYLMSFPYRIITAIWDSFAMQIIALRLLNIGLFIWGLVLYRRILVHTGLPRRTINIIMLFFTLVPTVLMVAVQVNYDAMMFLASGAAVLLAINLTVALRAKDKRVVVQFLALIAVLMAGSIVKYAFLPLAAAIGTFMIVQVYLAIRTKRLFWQSVRREGRQTLRSPAGWLLLISCIVVGILFVQRIGGNIMQYHTPAPDCSAVISLERCKAHAPYGRNQRYKEKNLAAALTLTDKLSYPISWYNKMLKESFFAIGPEQLGYPYGAPLPTAFAAGHAIVLALLICTVIGVRWLWRNPVWQLAMVCILVYMGVLFVRNYSEFLTLGVPVAIHGRYSIYIIPLLAALAAASASRLLRGVRRELLHGTLVLLLGLMLLGGGWLPYIIRSADNWMWPHAAPINHALRSVLWHVIPK